MAYGAGAMLRHWPALQQSGRFVCPQEGEALRQHGHAWLGVLDWPDLPPALRLAALPAVLARRDLARGSEQATQPRGLGDRARVMWRGLAALRAFERG